MSIYYVLVVLLSGKEVLLETPKQLAEISLEEIDDISESMLRGIPEVKEWRWMTKAQGDSWLLQLRLTWPEEHDLWDISTPYHLKYLS